MCTKQSEKTILVTGGCGYIGLHTIVDLIQNGYHVVCVDDNSNSNPSMLFTGVRNIVGHPVEFYCIDMKDCDALETIFKKHDIYGTVHFAAHKFVNASINLPLEYYKNNLDSLIHLLYCVDKYNVKYVVFSSSCTVYGSPSKYPVSESTPFGTPLNPYAATKQMGEQILTDFIRRSNNIQKICLLRYFNPAGAHPSLEIGEVPHTEINSLTSAIVGVASGRIPKPLTIFGNDYNTRDGTCVRDFIHVCDVASAHTKALMHMETSDYSIQILNLGSGNGITVKEAIDAFESVSNMKLNYIIGGRRSGDIEAIYADNTFVCSELGWNPKYTIHDIMKTAWGFEQRITRKL